jgi:hypothetical protein
MYIEHYAAGTSPTRPEIASVIVTVTFVSALPAKFFPVLSDSLSIQGQVPTINIGVLPGVNNLTIAGVAPTITIA